MPDLTAHPGGDFAADACARVVVGRVADFGEHRKSLSIGVDTQRDHAAPSHAVDTLRRALDIVRIEVSAGQHDEILRATADMESPLLVEVTQVSAVEPAICGQRHYTVGGEIVLGDHRAAQLDRANLPGRQGCPVPADPQIQARHR